MAAAIGLAAVENNLFLKQSEVHGMSQRGGDVQSHFRLSNKPVWSDLIPHGAADVIISVEPMESLRYLPWLSKTGWLVTNSSPHVNIPEYPQIEMILGEIKKLKNNIIIDADKKIRTLNEPSQPVGLRRGTKPIITEMALTPGIMIVIYTDGLETAGARSSRVFDIPAAIHDMLQDHPDAQTIAENLLQQALTLDQGRPRDDISILALNTIERESDGVRRLTVELPI